MKAKKIVIATLMAFGLIAICGEPTDNFVSTIIAQIIIFATTWGLAAYLADKWHIINH